MDTSLLKKAGLTESQAKGYLALIEHGAMSPTQLANRAGETRTNGYAIADKLVAYGLAIKNDEPKAIYRAAHPSALELLAEKRRKALVRNEQEVKQNISPLIDLFYAYSETPGTRTLQGVDGIKSVYEQTLVDKKDIYLLRTTSDISTLGTQYIEHYRDKRAQLGIHTYAFTPITDEALTNYSSGEDATMLFHRRFLPKDSYTAPVEIDVFGNKVALIAFGNTQMATIIDSPPVAEAMRQILQLVGQLLPPNDETFANEPHPAAIES